MGKKKAPEALDSFLRSGESPANMRANTQKQMCLQHRNDGDDAEADSQASTKCGAGDDGFFAICVLDEGVMHHNDCEHEKESDN